MPRDRPRPRHAREAVPVVPDPRRLRERPQERALEAAAEIELEFVADEIVIWPLESDGRGRIVCDILALRQSDGGRCVPVVVELKSERAMKRLVEQVTNYAGLMAVHQETFEALYSALLGREVRFDGPREKWIVWPAVEGEPRESELAARGIRAVGYVSTMVVRL